MEPNAAREANGVWADVFGAMRIVIAMSIVVLGCFDIFVLAGPAPGAVVGAADIESRYSEDVELHLPRELAELVVHLGRGADVIAGNRPSFAALFFGDRCE